MRFTHNGGGRTVFKIVKVSVYIQNIPHGVKDRVSARCHIIVMQYCYILLYKGSSHAFKG